MDIRHGYLAWIPHLDISWISKDILWISSLDIILRYAEKISQITKKISFHILSYLFISQTHPGGKLLGGATNERIKPVTFKGLRMVYA
jgi:hypothetical protein